MSLSGGLIPLGSNSLGSESSRIKRSNSLVDEDDMLSPENSFDQLLDDILMDPKPTPPKHKYRSSSSRNRSNITSYKQLNDSTNSDNSAASPKNDSPANRRSSKSKATRIKSFLTAQEEDTYDESLDESGMLSVASFGSDTVDTKSNQQRPLTTGSLPNKINESNLHTNHDQLDDSILGSLMGKPSSNLPKKAPTNIDILSELQSDEVTSLIDDSEFQSVYSSKPSVLPTVANVRIGSKPRPRTAPSLDVENSKTSNISNVASSISDNLTSSNFDFGDRKLGTSLSEYDIPTESERAQPSDVLLQSDKNETAKVTLSKSKSTSNYDWNTQSNLLSSSDQTSGTSLDRSHSVNEIMTNKYSSEASVPSSVNQDPDASSKNDFGSFLPSFLDPDRKTRLRRNVSSSINSKSSLEITGGVSDQPSYSQTVNNAGNNSSLDELDRVLGLRPSTAPAKATELFQMPSVYSKTSTGLSKVYNTSPRSPDSVSSPRAATKSKSFNFLSNSSPEKIPSISSSPVNQAVLSKKLETTSDSVNNHANVKKNRNTDIVKAEVPSNSGLVSSQLEDVEKKVESTETTAATTEKTALDVSLSENKKIKSNLPSSSGNVTAQSSILPSLSIDTTKSIVIPSSKAKSPNYTSEYLSSSSAGMKSIISPASTPASTPKRDTFKEDMSILSPPIISTNLSIDTGTPSNKTDISYNETRSPASANFINYNQQYFNYLKNINGSNSVTDQSSVNSTGKYLDKEQTLGSRSEINDSNTFVNSKVDNSASSKVDSDSIPQRVDVSSKISPKFNSESIDYEAIIASLKQKLLETQRDKEMMEKQLRSEIESLLQKLSQAHVDEANNQILQLTKIKLIEEKHEEEKQTIGRRNVEEIAILQQRHLSAIESLKSIHRDEIQAIHERVKDKVAIDKLINQISSTTGSIRFIEEQMHTQRSGMDAVKEGQFEARERLVKELEVQAKDRLESAESEGYKLKGLLLHLEHMTASFQQQTVQDKLFLQQETNRYHLLQQSLEQQRKTQQECYLHEQMVLQTKNKELELKIRLFEESKKKHEEEIQRKQQDLEIDKQAFQQLSRETMKDQESLLQLIASEEKKLTHLRDEIALEKKALAEQKDQMSNIQEVYDRLAEEKRLIQQTAQDLHQASVKVQKYSDELDARSRELDAKESTLHQVQRDLNKLASSLDKDKKQLLNFEEVLNQQQVSTSQQLAQLQLVQVGNYANRRKHLTKSLHGQEITSSPVTVTASPSSPQKVTTNDTHHQLHQTVSDHLHPHDSSADNRHQEIIHPDKDWLNNFKRKLFSLNHAVNDSGNRDFLNTSTPGHGHLIPSGHSDDPRLNAILSQVKQTLNQSKLQLKSQSLSHDHKLNHQHNEALETIDHDLSLTRILRDDNRRHHNSVSTNSIDDMHNFLENENNFISKLRESKSNKNFRSR